MISLRTALCLSGLLVIATGSAALDAAPESSGETNQQPPSSGSENQASAPRGHVSTSDPRGAQAGAQVAQPGGDPEAELGPSR